MRTTRPTSIAVCLFLFFAVPASAEDARAVLDRAIRAHGGEDRLERTTRGRIKSEMDGHEMMEGRVIVFKVTREEIFDLPARFRRTIRGTANGGAFRLEYAITGKDGWLQEEGSVLKRKLTEFTFEPLPLAAHWQTILANLPLLRGKDTQLTSLPEQRKDGRTLAGIRAASPSGASDFYFDKATGLLARSQWDIPSLLAGRDREMFGDNFYEDYKDIKGVYYPMKIKASAGNAQVVIVTVSTVEFLDKIEDSVFAKPITAAEPAKEGAAAKTTSETKPETKPVNGDSIDGEETPARRDPWLIVATLITGVVIGAVWLLVRASKRGKQRMPPR